MARDTVLAKMNPHHLVKVIDATNPSHSGQGNIDNTLQRFLTKTWQERAVFALPVTRSKRFRFECSSSTNSTRSLVVIDRNGKSVLSLGVPTSSVVPGNLDADGNAMTTYLWKVADLTDTALAKDGLYALKLTVDYNGTNIDVFVGEPFLLKNSHKDVIELEFYNSFNRDDTYFEQLPRRYVMNLHGILTDFQPLRNDTVTEDQNLNIVPLDSKAHEGWKLRIGGNGNIIADWLIRKLNYIFCCDSIKINGKRYVIGNGANWEPIRDPSNPLAGWSIDVVPADSQDWNKHSNADLDLYTVPAYPYMVRLIWIGEAVADISLAEGVAIHDSTEQAAFITALNAAVANADMGGTITTVSGVVRYINATGENYRSKSVVLYTTPFGYTFNSPGGLSPYPSGFTVKAADLVVEWGDGAVEVASAGGTPTFIGHSYPSGMGFTYNVKIWGTTQLFDISEPFRADMVGTLPTGLQSLKINSGTFPSNVFDYFYVAGVRLTLTTIVIKNAGLTSTTHMNSQAFPVLTLIDLSQNALTNTTMNQQIQFTNANVITANIYNGSLSVISQTPPASLNASGSFAASSLSLGYNWSVAY